VPALILHRGARELGEGGAVQAVGVRGRTRAGDEADQSPDGARIERRAAIGVDRIP